MHLMPRWHGQAFQLHSRVRGNEAELRRDGRAHRGGGEARLAHFGAGFGGEPPRSDRRRSAICSRIVFSQRRAKANSSERIASPAGITMKAGPGSTIIAMPTTTTRGADHADRDAARGAIGVAKRLSDQGGGLRRERIPRAPRSRHPRAAAAHAPVRSSPARCCARTSSSTPPSRAPRTWAPGCARAAPRSRPAACGPATRCRAPESFDWLLVMGGAMNADEEARYPWLAGEKRAIERAIAARKRVIGICLGSQLIARVLGAKVTRNRDTEIGWFPIERAEGAEASAVGRALPARAEVFHWHGDTFALPAGAVQLARSAACEQQGFVYDDRVLALQFHPEMTPRDRARLRGGQRGRARAGPLHPDAEADARRHAALRARSRRCSGGCSRPSRASASGGITSPDFAHASQEIAAWTIRARWPSSPAAAAASAARSRIAFAAARRAHRARRHRQAGARRGRRRARARRQPGARAAGRRRRRAAGGEPRRRRLRDLRRRPRAVQQRGRRGRRPPQGSLARRMGMGRCA